MQKLIRVLFCASLTTGALAAPTPAPVPLKAFVVADIRVTDPNGYQSYLSAISPVVKKFGGTYIARAGRTSSVEGPPPSGRIVIIEFPSYAAAEAFENSPEALAAGEIRQRTATSRIFIVEGWRP